MPCYDTLLPAMLAMDSLRFGEFTFNKNYFYDFSKRVLNNWNLLYSHGYYFKETLELPNLNFAKRFPGGYACSFVDNATDPTFFELPPLSADFEAVIVVSRASDRLVYGLPELIAPSAARIHAEWRIDLERRIDHLRKQEGLRAVW